MMSMSINSTTMLGNRSTKPSGIEMDELPFNRIRLRKKDNLEADLLAFSSRAGAGVVYGMLLTSRWTKPELSGCFPLITVNCGEILLRAFRIYQQVVMSSERICWRSDAEPGLATRVANVGEGNVDELRVCRFDRPNNQGKEEFCAAEDDKGES